MATEVYTTEIIHLEDDTEVELRPLVISKQRKFTRIWSDHLMKQAEMFKKADEGDELENISQADLTDAQLDAFIRMCSLGLESQLKGDKTEKKFLEYLEDNLNEATMYKVLEVCGGLKFDAPNPGNPATQAVAGTN